MGISILTICRNNLQGLKTTIASVLEQTMPPDEFLILDGASTDGTTDFLASGPPSIRWRSEPDRGIADAFNKITAMATSEWVIFLNAGDTYSDRDVLADLSPGLESAPPDVGVIFGDALIVDPENKEAPRISQGSQEFGRGSNPICHQAAFIRRSLQLAHPYDVRLKIGMDYDFWLRTRNKSQFVHVDRVVCQYQLGGMSSSKTWGEHSIAAHRMVEWLNSNRKLNWLDARGLLFEMLLYRLKKNTQLLLGDGVYRKLKRAVR